MHSFILSALLSSICLLAVAAEPGKSVTPQKPADVLQLTNLWTVHLKFTPEQWEGLEPKGGGGFFGGRGGPGGRGPGGPGGPGGFGPAMFMAPAFVKHGDKNQD